MADQKVIHRRVMFAASLAFLFVSGSVSQTAAEEPREQTEFTYDEFEANVRLVAERLLASCQDDDGQKETAVDLSTMRHVELAVRNLTVKRSRKALTSLIISTRMSSALPSTLSGSQDAFSWGAYSTV